MTSNIAPGNKECHCQ